MLSIKKINNKYLFFLRGHEIKDFYLFDDDINHLINVFNVKDIKRLEDNFNELLKSQDNGIKHQIKKMGEEGFIKNHIHQFIDPNELKVTINGREVNSDIANKEREEIDVRNIIVDGMVYFLTSLQFTSIDMSIRGSGIEAIKNNDYLGEEFDFIINGNKKDFFAINEFLYFGLIRGISKNGYIVDAHDIFDEELPEYDLERMSVSFFVKNKKITFNVILESGKQNIENNNVISIGNVKYRLRNNMSYSSVYNFLFNNN